MARVTSEGLRALTEIPIGGQRVVHSRGTRTQTVSICTTEGVTGRYERRYRLPIDVDASPAVLGALADLDALHAWLLRHGGEEEPGDSNLGRGLPPLVPASLATEAWIAEAMWAVERALRAVVEEFRSAPYRHRVEHSLHARLYELLVR